VVAGVVGTLYNLPFSPQAVDITKQPDLVLGENGMAFVKGQTTATVNGVPTTVDEIISFNLGYVPPNLGPGVPPTPNWTYQATAGSTLSLVAATAGNGLIAKTTNQGGADTVIRMAPGGGGDPTADTWTSAGYKLVDFLASDTFVANSLSSGQAQLIVSGQEVDWAFDSPWAKKQPDNRADPKVKLTLSVSNVYVTTPQDIQSNANITSTVNNAITFWWKKAKIQLNWNGTISAVKSCDPVLYPSGCGANPLLDIAEINSSTTATEFVRRLCTAGQVPKCTSSGSQLVFNQDQGSGLGYTSFTGPTSAAIFMNISAIGAGALEDSSVADSSNHDVSHELGHQFQLHHIGWSWASNLMCTGVLPNWPSWFPLQQLNTCPAHAGGRLGGDQVVDAVKGATQYQ
jgi:hypothetical protein